MGMCNQISPRFSTKYLTATHNALNGSIRDAFFLLQENKLRSITIPCFSTDTPIAFNAKFSENASSSNPKYQNNKDCDFFSNYKNANNFSCDGAATAYAALGGDRAVLHTFFRSLRRWMNKFSKDFDTVVLVPPTPNDAAVYRHLLKAYFPRTPDEEFDAQFVLPEERGNDVGEVEVAGRGIPLNLRGSGGKGSGKGRDFVNGVETKPTGNSDNVDECQNSYGINKGLRIGDDDEKSYDRPSQVSPCSDSKFGGMLAVKDTDSSSDDYDENNAKSSASEDEDGLFNSKDVSFIIARGQTDTEIRVAASSNNGRLRNSLDECELLHESFLMEAQTLANDSNFRRLEGLGFLYPSGRDLAGRPVMVFLGAVFPAATVEPRLLLLQIVKTMNPYIKDKYTLLYVNSDVHTSNTPCLSLLAEFLSLSSKYESNLDQLLVLHPGLLFKAAFTCCWPYIASHVWNGTFYLKSIADLEKHVEKNSVKLPPYVVQFDRKPKNILGMSF